MRNPARIAGLLTLGYGAAIVVKPKLMARPCELTDSNGAVPAQTATMIRALGLRDAISGASLIAAPTGKALLVAGVLRSASDVGDGLLLSRTLPTPKAKKKAFVVATGWGALCAGAVALTNASAARSRRRLGSAAALKRRARRRRR
jgi:hypothetical protein